MKSRKTGDPDDLDTVYKEVNDICILRLFETFLEAAPQLILQLYIIFMDTLQLGPLIGKARIFLLVDLRYFFSDLVSVDVKKNSSENDQSFSELFFFLISPEK